MYVFYVSVIRFREKNQAITHAYYYSNIKKK